MCSSGHCETLDGGAPGCPRQLVSLHKEAEGPGKAYMLSGLNARVSVWPFPGCPQAPEGRNYYWKFISGKYQMG